jgi:hypothetical protein
VFGRNRLCGDLAAEAEDRLRKALTRAFRRAAEAGEIDLPASGLTPAEAAELFRRAAAGLKGPGLTVEIYRARLAALARVFVAGLGGRAAGPRVPATRRRSSVRR